MGHGDAPDNMRERATHVLGFWLTKNTVNSSLYQDGNERQSDDSPSLNEGGFRGAPRCGDLCCRTASANCRSARDAPERNIPMLAYFERDGD